MLAAVSCYGRNRKFILGAGNRKREACFDFHFRNSPMAAEWPRLKARDPSDPKA